MQLGKAKTRMNADQEIKKTVMSNRHIGIHDYIQNLKSDEAELPEAFKQDKGPLDMPDLVRFKDWIHHALRPDWRNHVKQFAVQDPKMYGEAYLNIVRIEYSTRLYWYDRNLFAFLRLEGGKRQRKKMKRRIRSQCRGLTAARNMYEEALGMLGVRRASE